MSINDDTIARIAGNIIAGGLGVAGIPKSKTFRKELVKRAVEIAYEIVDEIEVGTRHDPSKVNN